MSKQSTVQRVIAAMEAERADLLAKAATCEHVITKLKTAGQPAYIWTDADGHPVAKPKSVRMKHPGGLGTNKTEIA